MSTAALTILSQFSSELGRSATISVLAPSFSHSAATFFSSSCLLAASTTLAPAPASVFADKRAEGARRAGDDGGLALDVEQRERVFQEGFGHFVSSAVMPREGGASSKHRALLGPRLRGDDTLRCHFGGIATATTMEQTSLPRLMISRVSFGSITQESFAFSTVSLPLTITVSSPRSTK